MTDLKYWVWLSLCVTPGSKTGDQLLTAFSADAKSVYDADEGAFREIEGLDLTVLPLLLNKNLDESEEIIQYCLVNRIGILPYSDPAYPSRLRRIERAPILLYYKGNLINFDDQVEIATVGTRHCSQYGSREAYRISRDLAASGAVVVSGMARGIDGVCHRGALDVGGYTIAVLGCGINRVYPPEHDELMKEIIDHGIVFTEYRPYTEPIGINFPARNRILSGLSLGTLVLEANKKSGALITAHYALKQGRDIFALPGKVGDAGSAGTNELIQKGAKMVQGAEDILTEYEFFYPHRISIEKISKYSGFRLESIDGSRKKTSNPYSRSGRTSRSSFPSKESVSDLTPSIVRPRKTSDIPSKRKETATVLPESNKPPVSTESVSPEGGADLSTYQLTPEQTDLLNRLSFTESILPDDLVQSSDIPMPKVLSALTVLEIKGLVGKLPGNRFIRLK